MSFGSERYDMKGAWKISFDCIFLVITLWKNIAACGSLKCSRPKQELQVISLLSCHPIDPCYPAGQFSFFLQAVKDEKNEVINSSKSMAILSGTSIFEPHFQHRGTWYLNDLRRYPRKRTSWPRTSSTSYSRENQHNSPAKLYEMLRMAWSHKEW